MNVMNLIHNPVGIVLAVFLSLGFFSCNNDNEINLPINRNVQCVEVSTMSVWLPTTRDIARSSFDMPVLHFKDELSYEQTIEKLNNMNKEERVTFFKDLGFEGAYTLWNHADEELEQIFENEDTLQLEELIKEYKAKYSSIFSFNTIDTYDVTPYFTFSDSELSLVGNIKGYVVVGNLLKSPQNNTPNYNVEKAVNTCAIANSVPIKNGFKGFRDATLSVKNGKYDSTMTFGRMVNENSFAIEFRTVKKAVLWKKETDSGYSADLAMHSSKFFQRKKVDCPYGKSISVLDIRIEEVGEVFDANVVKFISTRGNSIGRCAFQNIHVI